jgi:hypothetical protein
MILRWKSSVYKVQAIRNPAKDPYRFECRDLKTNEIKLLKFSLSGLLETADTEFKTMKKPKDIFLLYMGNHAKAIVATQE